MPLTPADYSRSQRIAELVMRVLGGILHHRVRDERLRAINITRVEVSRDLSSARVLITELQTASGLANPDREQARNSENELLRQARRAAPFLRKLMARELRELRGVPKLTFHIDREAQFGVLGSEPPPREDFHADF